MKVFLNYLFLSVLSFFIFTCTSCKKDLSPIDKEKKEEFCQITDTTSHNFVFEIDTLGKFGSYLFDVTAIDERNVWLVGKIDLIDGPESDKYNALKWNGDSLEYHKLDVSIGEGDPLILQLRAALSFSKNDIWFFSSGSYVHWDGKEWTSDVVSGRRGSIKKAWGSGPDNFYIVGSNGSITHYNGSSFTLMDSGTDRDLHDIAGYIDPETQLNHIWVAGELILLHYDGTKWEKVWDDANPLLPDSYNHPGALYAPDHSKLLVAAYFPVHIRGYCINTIDTSQYKQLFSGKFFAFDIAAQSINDLFVTGSANRVAHFNGSTLMTYPQMIGTSNNTGVAYINDQVFITGTLSGQIAIFIRGKRN